MTRRVNTPPIELLSLGFFAARRGLPGAGSRAADTGPGPWNGPRKVHPIFDHGVKPGPFGPANEEFSYRQRWTKKKELF